MTTPTITETRFRGLSPATTDILRRNTQLQQRAGEAVIGRTVAKFRLGLPELARLLDWLVEHEITGSGASSPEVKRLRLVRTDFKNARDGILTGDRVTIVTSTKADERRAKVIELLAEMWSGAVEKDWYEATELAEIILDDPMASVDRLDAADVRAWLDENL